MGFGTGHYGGSFSGCSVGDVIIAWGYYNSTSYPTISNATVKRYVRTVDSSHFYNYAIGVVTTAGSVSVGSSAAAHEAYSWARFSRR